MDLSKIAHLNPHLNLIKGKLKTKPSQSKGDVNKQEMTNILVTFCKDNNYTLKLEHKFLKDRKFRFDWVILELKLAIEYEGIMSSKSRHTTKTGYSKDTEKYNLALLAGYSVLRYTTLTFNNLLNHLKAKIMSTEKITFYSLEKCEPCQRLAPVATELFKKDKFSIVKVMRSDYDLIDEIKATYKTMGFPFLVIEDQGIPPTVITGTALRILLTSINK